MEKEHKTDLIIFFEGVQKYFKFYETSGNRYWIVEDFSDVVKNCFRNSKRMAFALYFLLVEEVECNIENTDFYFWEYLNEYLQGKYANDNCRWGAALIRIIEAVIATANDF